jgi:hypothetical protein
MSTLMRGRFLVEGLRFFATAFVLGLVLLAVAPLDVVRLLCVFALACAAAGFALNFVALRVMEPGTLAVLHARMALRALRFRHRVRGAFTATHEATDTVWPCVVR